MTAVAFRPSSLRLPERFPTLALFALALPMIGMTVSRMLMGFIDFFMVSHLGTVAQAAISPSTLLLFVIACTGMGMAQGLQTFVSQADGRGEPQRAGGYVWQALYLAALAALASAPAAYFAPVWFRWIGDLGRHEPALQQMEIDFLRIALWSIGPMTACAGLESFYNGIRKPMIGFVAVLVSLVVITVGNWVLIFGHLGFPALGIAGSGLATLLAWCARLAVLLVPLGSRAIDERYGIWRSCRFVPGKLLEIVRLGGPIALQWLVDIGAWLVFVELMLPRFGTTALAAANLAIQFMHLSFMPALGLGIALTTQVGNAVGAGRADEAVLRVRVARRVIVVYMGLMALLFAFAGGPMASLLCFEQDAATRALVIATAAIMARWVAVFQIADALCIVYSFALRGAGDTRVPAMLFALCCWGIFVAGGYALIALAPHIEYHGPWLMCSAYIGVLAILLWRRFHSRAWERLRLFKDTREETPATAASAQTAPAESAPAGGASAGGAPGGAAPAQA